MFIKILGILLNKKYLFICSIFIIVFVLSILKIHGSSIGMYNNFFLGNSYKDENLLFGKPRSIRSDEWVFSTPLYISQTKNNLSTFNQNIGLGQKLITPSKNWFNIFYPANFAFFVLPVEYAFSWLWWFRGGLVIFSIYMFLLLITKKNLLLSITGSLIFFFSPFIQWWYSTWALEAISYSFLIICLSINCLNFKNKFNLILNCFFLTYLLICYALSFYPPYQISMGLFILFFILGYVLNNKLLVNINRLKMISVSLAMVFFIVSSIVVLYYISFQDLFNLLRNTSYPGKRIVTGGEYSLMAFFSGFFNIKLLSDGTVPKLLGNQSEASSFFMFFPFLLPFTFYYSIKNIIEKKKTDFIVLFLSFYLLISTIWIFWGLPGFLSKLLLLNLVPHNRMIIGIGIANLLLAFCFLSNFKIKISKNYITLSFILATIAFLVHLYIGYYLQNFFPEFISSDFEIILISFSAFLSVLLLLFQRRKVFILFILIYSIFTSYSVNPLYKGLDPIINSKLSKEIKEVNSKNNDKSRWVVYHDYYMGNYLVANGINSINGVHLYPQLNLWKEFDPNKKYYDVYNRYAHVFFFNNSSNSIVFNLLQPDAFNVKINPCNKVLTNLKIKYVLSPLKLKEPCLKQIKKVEYPNITYFIYEKSGL